MTVPLAALRERVPGVAGRRVARIDQGWDFDVFVVDSGLAGIRERLG